MKKNLSMARLRLAGIVAGAVLAGGLLGGAATAFQSHMFSALHSLEVARAELATAVPDKAGYRVRAASLVDQAIGAVKAGIAAGAH